MESYCLIDQHIAELYIINVWHLLIKAQDSTLHRIMVSICSSDICRKYCLAGVEALAQWSTCRMHAREMQTTKAEEVAEP